MEDNTWYPVKGFEELYLINKVGLVINAKTGKPRTIIMGNRGYMTIGLWKNNKNHVFLYHKLLAISFIPNPKDFRCVNHIDGNKLNNKLSNLEWCSHSYNNKHAYEKGLKTPYTRAIIQYDSKMNIVNRFSSLTEAGRTYNLSCISRCLTKTHLKHSGFYWRYA